MRHAGWGWAVVLAAVGLAASARGADDRFRQSADAVEAYDFVEVTLALDAAPAGNPFTEAEFDGWFEPEGGPRLAVDGFCDGDDGRAFRIRFLPAKPGAYRYGVTYRRGATTLAHEGTFTARDGGRKGMVRIDKDHPYHFAWEGTGEGYFWNGTTTYFLLGWRDVATIRSIVDRLADQKVNRLRVALNGRNSGGDRWSEPLVQSGEEFRFRLEPWPAARSEDPADPGYDVTRFNLPHWRKMEELLRHALERDVVVSVIFHVDGRDAGVDPFGKERAGGEDERRYYRYAVARLAAYSNVMWDVTNEYHLFRDVPWVNAMGAYLKDRDPYDHLTSVHGNGDFPFRTEPWCDFAMFQAWDEGGGHEFMRKNRREQAATGRPMPQVNEEYGYEDHYPTWGSNRRPPARSADNRRRLAWGMVMAGGYQSTGERADRGTSRGADAGGGWINGRGDAQMVMLRGYARMVDFFTAFDWRAADPHDELVTGDGAMALAEPGKAMAVYLPRGGRATATLEPGRYRVRRYNPRTGEWLDLPDAEAASWTSPAMPTGDDWALLLTRRP
jgi:hypothetical protein